MNNVDVIEKLKIQAKAEACCCYPAVTHAMALARTKICKDPDTRPTHWSEWQQIYSLKNPEYEKLRRSGQLTNPLNLSALITEVQYKLLELETDLAGVRSTDLTAISMDQKNGDRDKRNLNLIQKYDDLMETKEIFKAAYSMLKQA